MIPLSVIQLRASASVMPLFQQVISTSRCCLMRGLYQAMFQSPVPKWNSSSALLTAMLTRM